MHKNEEILCPPGIVPTKEQIRIAKTKYFHENYVYDFYFWGDLYFEAMEKGDEHLAFKKEKIKEEYKRILELWDKKLESWDEEPMEDMMVNSDFFQYYINGLSEMHFGDCVAMATSCIRCHSERMFGFPSSITWKGKAEGHKIYHEYYKNYKESEKGGNMK